jgi:hypothetical protein
MRRSSSGVARWRDKEQFRPIILYPLPANSSVVIHGFGIITARNYRAEDLTSRYPS